MENLENVIKVGPCGGSYGSSWYTDASKRLVKIRISHRDLIDMLEFGYDGTNETVLANKNGSPDGKITEINLKPGEFLTYIKGYFDAHTNTSTMVMSLTFTTNLGDFGPYGRETGTLFYLRPPQGSVIVGFYGLANYFINAIGVFARPMAVDQRESVVVGPCGGAGGYAWDEHSNGSRRVHAVWVRYSDRIHSVSFRYNWDGQIYTSRTLGSSQGTLAEIILEPDEFLMGVNGYFEEYQSNLTLVTSLSLVTNTRTWGPYGPARGTPFSLPATGSQIVGFLGRSSDVLHSIGIYVLI